MPVALLDAVAGVPGAAGRVLPAPAAKAELARIGRYYVTESMLVLDPDTAHHDAAATLSTGAETLFDFYARWMHGGAGPEHGDHAVFWRRALACAVGALCCSRIAAPRVSPGCMRLAVAS